jgi:endonuclease/exonuclease/phosphatase (EEP) superfamily protein YafD
VFALLPRFVGSSSAAPDSIPIRVLTANLGKGAADPQALIAVARDRADLVVVQELTPESADGLFGLESEFRYQAVEARESAAGSGIWSRYPIIDPRRDSQYLLGMLSATLRVPGAASDTSVLALHVVGPWPQPIDDWRREMAELPDTLRAAADIADPGAVIVAGDFNATIDMRPFRQLLEGGFRHAGEQSGAGLTPTFPADRSVPPLIGIDHILTFNSTATIHVPG